MNFCCALYFQLEKLSSRTAHQGFLKRSIEENPCGSPVVSVVEQVCRAKLGVDPSATVDWTTCPCAPGAKAAIDWAALLAFIEQLLPIILPLIIPKGA